MPAETTKCQAIQDGGRLGWVECSNQGSRLVDGFWLCGTHARYWYLHGHAQKLRHFAIQSTDKANRLADDLGYERFRVECHKAWKQADEIEGKMNAR